MDARRRRFELKILWVDATVHWKLNTIAFSNKEGYVSVWTRALDMFVRSFLFFRCLAKVECFKRFCHFWNYCDCSFFRFSLQLLEQVGFGNVKAVDNTARFVEVLKVERARFETEKSLFLKVQKNICICICWYTYCKSLSEFSGEPTPAAQFIRYLKQGRRRRQWKRR